MQNIKPQIKKLSEQADALSSAVYKLKKSIEILEQTIDKPDYSKIPGVSGTFDGFHMLGEDGKKYEVPANYAAKTRLLFGDNLKMVEEAGKTLFKLIEKQPKQKVPGVLSKKDGKWYLLTDLGTYRISDVAANFNGAELNLSATGIIPEGKTNVPFAALDQIHKEEEDSISSKDTVAPTDKAKPKEKTALAPPAPVVTEKQPETSTSADASKEAAVAALSAVVEGTKKDEKVVASQEKAPRKPAPAAPKPQPTEKAPSKIAPPAPVAAEPAKQPAAPTVVVETAEKPAAVASDKPAKPKKKEEPKPPVKEEGTSTSPSGRVIEDFDLR